MVKPAEWYSWWLMGGHGREAFHLALLLRQHTPFILALLVLCNKTTVIRVAQFIPQALCRVSTP